MPPNRKQQSHFQHGSQERDRTRNHTRTRDCYSYCCPSQIAHKQEGCCCCDMWEFWDEWSSCACFCTSIDYNGNGNGAGANIGRGRGRPRKTATPALVDVDTLKNELAPKHDEPTFKRIETEESSSGTTIEVQIPVSPDSALPIRF